ncbi:DUF11 domain-containing protein [Spirosoma foliorum]|uniref:PKD domain-containing protein n=1 Tax=Spirosoma foliorum TaxID=2710596 RepID=A0A7G5GYJ6_9BACT|nr:DUF11 domain-containing protein [Spirosoma foliorum]QMW03938.1 hypothetical protein H3H32_02980 [Spirosoma foliorum]
MRSLYYSLAVFITAVSSLFAQSYSPYILTITNSPVCAGQSFQINATYSIPPSGTTVSFRWAGPNSFTSSGSNAISVPASAATAGVYSVTMTYSGTSQGTEISSATVSLGTSKPRASVYDQSFYTRSRSICGPTSLSFVAFPDRTFSSNTATYRWTGPNGFVSTEQNPVVPQGVAGLYIVEATYPNNCGVGKDTVQIYNTTLSVSANSYSTGSNPQPFNTFCPETSAELRATAYPSTGTTVTYQWRGPSGFTSTAQSFTLPSVTTAVAGTYSVTATFSGSCPGTATASQTIQTGQLAVPIGSFRLNTDGSRSSAQTVCPGSNFVVSAYSMAPSSYSATFRWSGPNGFTSNIDSPTLTNATTAMSGLYSVTATLSTGCSGTNSVNMNIGLPTIAVTSATTGSNTALSGTFCPGSSFGVSTTPSLEGLSATYLWNGPNGFSSTSQSFTMTNVTYTMTGTYSVTATLSGACTGAITASKQIQITKPLVSLYSQSTDKASYGNQYCPGTSFDMYPIFFNGPNGFPSSRSTLTYQWSGPNGFTSSAKQPTIPTASTLASGTYNLTVNVSGECSGTYSNAQGITIGKPISYISAYPLAGMSPATDTYCPGATIFLSAYNSIDSTSVASYHWKGPNGFTSSAQRLTLVNATTAMSGVYSLTTVYTGQCAGTRVSFANVIIQSATMQIGVFRSNGGGGGTPPLCLGNTYRLAPNAMAYNSNDVLTQNSYEWTLPDGSTSTSPSLSISSASAANAGLYILKTTFGGACASAITRDTASITVGITAPKIWTSNSFIASGRSTVLYADKCIGSDVQWSDGQMGRSIIVTPNQTTIYTATCLGYEGCVSPPSAPLTVRISDQPETDLSLQLSVNNRIAVIGKPITMTLTINNSSSQEAHNVQIESRLPALMAVVNAGSFQADGTVIRALVTNIPANGSVDLYCEVAPTITGVFRLAAQITGTDNPDPDSAPASGTNDGQDDVAWIDLRTTEPGSTISESPEPNPAYLPSPKVDKIVLPDELVDLSLTTLVSNAAPSLNELITVTLLVDNYNNTRLLSPEVTCLLPAGLTFVDGKGMVATGQQIVLTGGQYFPKWPQAFTFQVQATGPINEPIKARISHCDWEDIDSDPTNGFDTGEDDTAQISLRLK